MQSDRRSNNNHIKNATKLTKLIQTKKSFIKIEIIIEL